MATFSKEQGITVIGICSAFDIIIVCGIDMGCYLSLGKLESTPAPSNGTSTTNGTRSNKVSQSWLWKTISNKFLQGKSRYSQWQISLIKRHLLLVVAATFLLAVRWRVMGSAPPTFQVHDNPHSFVEGGFFRALNYNYLYAINAWILVCPQWLCFDWSMGCVPTIESLTDVRLVCLAALWTVLSLLAWTCLYAENTRLKRSLSLAMALIIIPFLPATNILFRVGFVVAERVLYLPSAGFCLVVVLGVQQLSLKKGFSKVIGFGFLLLLLVFSSRSVQRSNEWRRGMWLFKSGENVCPLNAKVHYNIAKLSSDSGNTTFAIEQYELAIKLNPVYDQAMNNLANIYKDQNKVEEAEILLDKAVQISPDFAAAWMNRGIVKGALKKYSEAEHSYKQGIRCRRNYPDCYYNLGNLYLDMNRSQDALDAWRNATVLKPTHWNSWNNAIILMDNLKMYDQAENLALTALKIMPDNPSLIFSLANVYGKQEKYAESEKMFLAAIKRDPSNPNIHLNLGVLYHRWGKYNQAEASYQRSLLISPNNAIALENMNLLKAKMKSSS
ncbi:unnamed protein product [Lymnaea stagnalis]|uniref:dolichyl-phosphate-mannose--protein mannosyltransferase n=1 Tax=Lymnaea stagnalis TaxID=6523 RepID=A0AAV2HBT2_LYMST